MSLLVFAAAAAGWYVGEALLWGPFRPAPCPVVKVREAELGAQLTTAWTAERPSRSEPAQKSQMSSSVVDTSDAPGETSASAGELGAGGGGLRLATGRKPTGRTV